MITLDIDQRSEEWTKARLGIPTASEFNKIITTKGEPSKQAKKYMYQLAGERVTGFKEESYKNGAMERGIEMEAEARKFYEVSHEAQIKTVGFCLSDDKRYGCSPDGLVGDDGLIEIKCPLMATHVGYLLDNKLPTDYFQQIQGQLLVTGREWCDFISYYPGLKPMIIRIHSNAGFRNDLAIQLDQFCMALDQVEKEIR